MRSITVFLLFLIALSACISAKVATPSVIDVVPLNNYALSSKFSLSDSVNYRYIVDAAEFHQMFFMTKATRSTAIVPDFKGQCVVAIILKPTEKVITVDINKAEMAGNDLNIYYTITDTTSWKTYAQIPKAVAIIRKSLNVKKVNFYRNNSKERTLTVN